MAVVPGYGVVYEGEHGRIEKFDGKSFVFKVLETLKYNELGTRTKRYWCKEHANIKRADFLKVEHGTAFSTENKRSLQRTEFTSFEN